VIGRLKRLFRGPRDAAARPFPPLPGEEEWERIAPELFATGPGVTGATGGSGTRVVARIVRRGGLFIGADLNVSEDALDFAAFSDRWIDRYWASGPAPAMAAELRALVARQGRDREEEGQRWGWKEPRTVYLLPFLDAQLPGLRFLHVVRDGRDMAYSSNQMQLHKHGEAVLDEAGESQPLRSIALWSDVNLRAADHGERHMGDRYLRLRFEDLCEQPVACVETVLRFFGLEGDARAIAAEEVQHPGTFGRWRERDPRETAALTGRATEALERFGYQSSSA
jgi:Sulfotransferase family